ncbi:histidine phosphatase family protein [Lutispora thermophila]|uniref:2,3-bisphosphoglycerate-dependent phosphoglycerate mutase n=1 Tax=Lutispora thermophila DSM 19022 TaxID=1122184 RepID=A0A1M6CJV4_9FIRM|nr:histidine phosphatase family protein [Lutispora thermophila]SHI61305.1 2,3-bisphosphoglycerate-dependent phosphoglycerate mutase [Lutispora thermophila DSM 19022]
MKTHIYFVRHAHSIYTPDELGRPLSQRGLLDAQIVTDLLKRENIDRVYSSPYKRAMQTVEGIAKYIDKDIVIVDEFKERVLSEKPVEDFTSAITKLWQDFDFSWDGGESNRMAQKRGVNATIRLLESNEGKNFVVGTHGNIMVLIMNYFDKKYGFSFWSELEMPDIYKLSFNSKELVDVQRIRK